MRTIKFRGYGIVEKKWFYGNLVEGNAGRYITDAYYEEGQGDMIRYDPIQTKTIGQFTGLLDKNGKEIYEGDIIHLKRNDYDKDFGIVKWHNDGYFYVDDNFGKFPKDSASPIGNFFDFLSRDFEGIEVSVNGNIHDNPELLNN